MAEQSGDYKMKIMGIDFGEKRAGISLSDHSKKIGFPFKTIEFKNTDEFIRKIKDIVEKEGVCEIVLGNPLNMDGEKGEMSIKIENLKIKIENLIKIPIILWDERWTTIEAEKYLIKADFSREKRKKKIDTLASAIILQSYLDSKKKENDCNKD